jgi:hypothetical protein
MDKFTVPSSKHEIHRPVFPLEKEIPNSDDIGPSEDSGGDTDGTDSEGFQRHFRQSISKMEFSTEFHRGSRSGGVGYKLVAWSFVAALIDSLVLFSLSCLFLVSFSLLVKSQMGPILQVMGSSIYQAGLLGGGVLILTYMIMLRVFLGFTIGEWACSLRLGNLKQRLNRFYSLRVVARMCLICMTGLVVIPFFSLLTGRDLAGLLIRLPLIQVKGS